MSFRAVVFDLGGVVLDSPLETLLRFERETGLAPGSIARLTSYADAGGAWARLERGELDVAGFGEALEAAARAAGFAFSAEALLELMAASIGVRPEMLAAVRALRARGLRTAALTNNWPSWDALYERVGGLRDEFDVFLESWRVGLRKPEPAIYRMVLEQLGVGADETVFLDDLGLNLKPARALGMATIKVADPATALADLERVLAG